MVDYFLRFRNRNWKECRVVACKVVDNKLAEIGVGDRNRSSGYTRNAGCVAAHRKAEAFHEGVAEASFDRGQQPRISEPGRNERVHVKSMDNGCRHCRGFKK